MGFCSSLYRSEFTTLEFVDNSFGYGSAWMNEQSFYNSNAKHSFKQMATESAGWWIDEIIIWFRVGQAIGYNYIRAGIISTLSQR